MVRLLHPWKKSHGIQWIGGCVGLWSVVIGLWPLVCGLWSLVFSLRSLVFGLWSSVFGLWSQSVYILRNKEEFIAGTGIWNPKLQIFTLPTIRAIILLLLPMLLLLLLLSCCCYYYHYYYFSFVATATATTTAAALIIIAILFTTTILLTYSWSRVLLEKLPGLAANQEIPRILWNPKIH
jgi:hypothetical protein